LAALLILGLLLASLLLETWVLAHCAAPVMALVFAILLLAMRHLYEWRWREQPVGRWMVQASITDVDGWPAPVAYRPLPQRANQSKSGCLAAASSGALAQVCQDKRLFELK
jgi:hypothetical protein